MKIQCIKENLISAVNLLTRIATKNATLPILSSIYMEVNKKQVSLRATNLEVGVVVGMRAAVEREGGVVLSSQILSGVINEIKEDKIIIEKQGDGIEIKTETFKTKIKGLKTKEFPLIPQIKGDVSLKMGGECLSGAIGQVISSAAISNMRPDLAGVYVAWRDGCVYFVATDGFRLSERMVKLKGDAKTTGKESGAIIIPGKTASEIVHIFGKTKEDVDIIIEESQIAIKSANIYLVSRIIDGNYPDYTQIIPKEHKTEVIVGREDLLGAIKIASLFSSVEANEVTLEAWPTKKEMAVSAESKEKGQALKKIKIRGEGKSMKITLNHRYLADGIGNIKEKEIKLLVDLPKSPVLIKPYRGDDKKTNFLCMVSPIKKQ